MVETVIFDYISLQYDLDIENSILILPHDTLAHDVASPNTSQEEDIIHMSIH